MQTNISLKDAKLTRLITHHVGNRTHEGQLLIREDETQVADDETESYLTTYFLGSLKTEEVFELTHTIDLNHNPVYTLASSLLNDPNQFVEISIKLAQLLYESSTHPRVKEGKLSVAIFDEIRFGDEICRGIGIFKSETSVPFLQIHEMESSYAFSHDFGFELKGLDKACLIIDRNMDNGFSLLIRDHASKQLEAQYWIDDFLGVRPMSNDYNLTKQYLSLTKDFVVNTATEDFMMSPPDKIDILNKTMDYFKGNETFDKDDFTKSIFPNEKMQSAFLEFDSIHEELHSHSNTDSFDISQRAVKSQSNIYKSVLKLDKNFHVYIHGDRSMIERGIDPDGRKYYKIYYENES